MGTIIKVKNSFKGGIHVPEYKELTEDKPIKSMPLPSRVTIYLQQHLGAPAKETVKVGDEVKTGQVIGEPSGFISAYVHSPITGKVLEIKETYHPLGTKSKAIIIEKTSDDEWIKIENTGIPDKLSRDEILEIIKKAGIVGLGGATFPTHVKLNPPKDKKIDTLIINAAECEPFLNVDNRLIIERTEDFIKGIKIILKLLPVKCYIGIEDNKPEAIKVLSEVIKKENNIDLFVLPTKYPQGGEKQLIYAITKRIVPSGKLPFDVGIIVQNVSTVIAIYEAVYKGKPLIEKVTTVSGDAINEPSNVKFRIGTSFEDIINFCGGYKKEPAKIIMGGPMMGFAQFTDKVGTIKGTSGILVFSEKIAKLPPIEPCIYCGRCVDACPMGLAPVLMGKNIYVGNYLEAKKLNLLDCIECGCCNYVCPANRPLVQLFKYGKFMLRKMKK